MTGPREGARRSAPDLRHRPCGEELPDPLRHARRVSFSDTGLGGVGIIVALWAHLFAVSPAQSMPVGEIRGCVIDQTVSSPIAGAVVRAGESFTVTGVDGSYRLPIAMSGRIFVGVEAKRHHPIERIVTFDGGSIRMDFELEPRHEDARVVGTVYDRIRKRPVAKAEVRLGDEVFRTGEGGQFAFDPVEAGERWISVAAVGYRGFSGRLAVQPPSKQADVYLTPAMELSCVEGIVLDRITARPVPLASVHLENDRAVTDANGRFVLSERIPGPARLVVHADGFYPLNVPIVAKAGNTKLTVVLEPRTVEAMRAAYRDMIRKRFATRPGPPPPPPPQSSSETRIDAPPPYRLLTLDLIGWTSEPVGALKGRGMELILPQGASFRPVTAKRTSADIRLSPVDRFVIDHVRFDHQGTLARKMSLDGFDYRAGAALGTRTDLLGVGLAKRLLDSPEGSAWLDYGMLEGRTTVQVAQEVAGPPCTNYLDFRTGTLTTDFSAPYLGVTGRSKLSDQVALEVSAKGGAVFSRGSVLQMTDSEMAFLFGGAFAGTPEESAWFGTLGYRIFQFYGQQKDGGAVDLTFSGPTFGIKGRM